METETIFRILLPVLLFGFVLHRGLQTRKRAPDKKRIDSQLDTKTNNAAINALALLALVSSLIYVIFPAWLAWAGLPLPLWLRWLSIPIALLGFGLLEWAQAALGKNWSDTSVQLKDHSLASHGPYRFVRHPIYTGFLVILSTPLLISANWLVGLAWMGMAYLDINSRAAAEERMLAETFGQDYQNLERTTGRFFPRLVRKR